MGLGKRQMQEINEVDKNLLDFFLWFRENGEKHLDKSIERMILEYQKEIRIKNIVPVKP